jgi:hypothetical protein
MIISCGSDPKAEITDILSPPAEIDTISADNISIIPNIPNIPNIPHPPVEGLAFDPHSVSQDRFNSTKIEVQHFIEELNRIIRNKNYTAWKAELSPSFFAEISSRQFLQQVSETDAMKNRGIVLRTPEDYFINVVVPSRANSRVDDIEFVSQNRVKAYTVMTNRDGQPQRLRLYELEYIEKIWRIVN